jgi:hypothetical protein
MSGYVLTIKMGICFAFIGLMTILIRQLLPKKKAGIFTCFALALGAVSILKALAMLSR